MAFLAVVHLQGGGSEHSFMFLTEHLYQFAICCSQANTSSFTSSLLRQPAEHEVGPDRGPLCQRSQLFRHHRLHGLQDHHPPRLRHREHGGRLYQAVALLQPRQHVNTSFCLSFTMFTYRAAPHFST